VVDPEAQSSGSAEAAVLGESELQSTTLEELASAVNYHRWLTDLALPHLGDHPVEVGSGLGDYAQRWLDAGIPKITVSDADPGRLGRLHRRFDGDRRVEVVSFNVHDSPIRAHSSLVSFNVLEHIPDDVGVLAAAHGLLRPGGRVITFVPAFKFALGRFDRRVGHVRRYTTASLAASYRHADLSIDRVHYVNAPGLIAWIVGMKLLRLTPGDSPIVRLWDRTVIPLARRLEEHWTPAFGQSVFAVGRVAAQRSPNGTARSDGSDPGGAR
jgi:hypothetical protein